MLAARSQWHHLLLQRHSIRVIPQPLARVLAAGTHPLVPEEAIAVAEASAGPHGTGVLGDRAVGDRGAVLVRSCVVENT